MSRLREVLADLLREDGVSVSREWIHEQETRDRNSDLDSRSQFGEEYRRAVARRIQATARGSEKVVRPASWTRAFGS